MCYREPEKQDSKTTNKITNRIQRKNKKQADELKKEEFKGSSKIGNAGIPRNAARQFKKTFK